MYRYLCNLFLAVMMTLAIQYMSNAGEAIGAVTTSGCINTNTSCTLEELFLGGSFTVNGITFESWDIFDLNLNTPFTPDFEEIDVIPLDDQLMNPGVRYNMNGEFSLADDRFISLFFDFNVVASNSALFIKDNSLQLTDYAFGGSGGAIFIDEDVFDWSDESLISKSVFADNFLADFELSDSAVFAPQSQILAGTAIFMFGDDVGDSVQVNSFEQHFSVVPEPVSSILFLSGGVTLAVRQLRKRKKRVLRG